MIVSTEDRAHDVLALATDLTSLDPMRRRGGAEWSWARAHSGGLIEPQLAVLAQLCVWAWVAEPPGETAEEFMRALGVLGWSIAPAQVAGIARALERRPPGDAEADFLEDLDDYLLRDPGASPRLLDDEACRRAVDLARGLTSADSSERLSAARLAADVVASRDLADEEAGCFAGLLSYAVVIESDPAVRHEQATVLAIAAHHGRLSEDHREIALAADLTDEERTAIMNTGPTRPRQET